MKVQKHSRESCNVLEECIELQNKKANDYQNASSSVKQADYYVNGISTIYDIMHAKMLRLKSVQEAMQNDRDYKPNFESLEDSARDLINYASFYAAYLRHAVPGQDVTRDSFNKPYPTNETPKTTFAVNTFDFKPYRDDKGKDHSEMKDANGMTIPVTAFPTYLNAFGEWYYIDNDGKTVYPYGRVHA